MFWKDFKISQKLFFGFGLVILLMIGVMAYSFNSFIKESEAVKGNLEAYNVVAEVNEAYKSLLNIETGARGYAIAGIDGFLLPFEQGKADFEKHFNTLKTLTADNPKHQERLVALQKHYQDWIEFETIYLVKERQKVLAGQSKMDDLIAVIQKETGKKYMDDMRSVFGEIIAEEQNVLAIRGKNLETIESQTGPMMLAGGIVATMAAVLIALWITTIVVKPVKTVTNTFMEIADGEADLNIRLKETSNDEIGEMAKYFNIFVAKLKTIILENKNVSWLKAGQAELNEQIRGEQDVETLAAKIITYVAKYVGAKIGAIYIKTPNNTYKLFASYAYQWRKHLSNEVQTGEGIIGQAILEKQIIILENIPDNYIKITSGVGQGTPKNILVSPCAYNNEVKCVLEVGSFQPFSEIQLEFMEQIGEIIALAIHSNEARLKTQELLEKTLMQAEELQAQQEELRQSNEELGEQTKALQQSEARLQAQQEELRQSNEELEEHTKALRESEAQLQTQQEELRVINEELEERTKSLEMQKNEIVKNNENLRKATIEIEDKAKALEVASKYKSEFLANMSHELRTPLNSILVLSQMLADKKDNGPLNEKQLEFAKTIHSSGEDLLKLINDILDLSKVEAGKMEAVFEELHVDDLVHYVERSFRPIAVKQGLDFDVRIAEGAPHTFLSDNQRLQQIINNLLSNAFKFTKKGSVSMVIGPYSEGDSAGYLRIAITDTGIGIPVEKQGIIFEAFKQSDGTTSRKYGGTGLGLSISKDLAKLLGGRIEVTSELGAGSTFSLLLPLQQQVSPNEICASDEVLVCQIPEMEKGRQLPLEDEGVFDERQSLALGDKRVLIIEDDEKFCQILVELAREKGYKCIVAKSGRTGLKLAKTYQPQAVLLDIGLPDISGWKVIEQLKQDAATGNIPIHVISGSEARKSVDTLDGVVGYLQKPVSPEALDAAFEKIEALVSKPCKKLLIIDENGQQTNEIAQLIGNKDLQIRALDKGQEAIALLKEEPVDCIILDLKLKDMSGFELLQKMKEEDLSHLPVIIHTEKVLSQDDEVELKKYAESIIIKGSRSVDRLIAETTLFLRDLDTKMGETKIKAIKSEQEKEASFKDRKILVVDDDMRNVFALSSLLEEKGMKVVAGRNGRECLDKLAQNPDVDLILMDIMMPEMDGYAAMGEIRKNKKYRKIPIIALTAKAMKDDRQKCIEAGASDYLTKPLDIDKLTSLLRVWLYK